MVIFPYFGNDFATSYVVVFFPVPTAETDTVDTSLLQSQGILA